jgi:hypothetical protein
VSVTHLAPCLEEERGVVQHLFCTGRGPLPRSVCWNPNGIYIHEFTYTVWLVVFNDN